MALLYFTGFDGFSTLQDLVDAGWQSTGASIQQGQGRYGGNRFVCGTGWAGSGGYMTPSVQFSSTSNTLISGYAFISSGPGSMLIGSIVGADGLPQLHLGLDATGHLAVTNGYWSGQTPMATGPTVIQANTWYYFEWKSVISNTGSSIVRINGVEEINYSGDTQWQSTDTIIGYRWSGTHAFDQNPQIIDDWYLCDGSGSAPYNDFLGDVACQVMYPSNNGVDNQWVGNDGNSTNNYQMVDEQYHDDDTTYVASATIGDRDIYDYGSISATSGTVYAVQTWTRAMKDQAGARAIKSVHRLADGTETESAEWSIGGSYTYYRQLETEKPGGGVWSISDVNGAQFGVKVTG